MGFHRYPITVLCYCTSWLVRRPPRLVRVLSSWMEDDYLFIRKCEWWVCVFIVAVDWSATSATPDFLTRVAMCSCVISSEADWLSVGDCSQSSDFSTKPWGSSSPVVVPCSMRSSLSPRTATGINREASKRIVIELNNLNNYRYWEKYFPKNKPKMGPKIREVWSAVAGEVERELIAVNIITFIRVEYVRWISRISLELSFSFSCVCRVR